MSNTKYVLDRVSEEAKNAYLQHAIDEFHPHDCGPRLMRILEEATVPESLTAKEVVEKVEEWANLNMHSPGPLFDFLEVLNVE